MIAKKVIRYYSECGRGFWKKQQAISHDENCKCWKNPKFKSCLSCKHKCIIKDSNGKYLKDNETVTFAIEKGEISATIKNGGVEIYGCGIGDLLIKPQVSNVVIAYLK